MRTIALETTDKAGSIALLDDGQIVAKCDLDPLRRSAQSLAPALQDLLSQARWSAADVQLVAVAAGPGSFTGLRVGVTTAKTLAYVSGADVVAVNALEVIASQAPVAATDLWVVMDAQRHEVFAGRFQRSPAGHFNWVAPTQILANGDWLAGVTPGQWVSGPALKKLSPQLADGVSVVEPGSWLPTAAAVGQLALAHHRGGKRDDLWSLVPWYFRRSAAEEKWDERAAEAQNHPQTSC